MKILLCFILLNASIALAIDNQQWHHYFWANYKQFGGKIQETQRWYRKVFEGKSPKHAYQGYLHFLFETEQFGPIVQVIPRLDKQFENDPEIQKIFALALERIGRKEEAVKRFMVLSKKFKTNQEIVFRTVQLFIEQGQITQALDLINTYLNNIPRRPNNFIFYFLKSQLHLQLKQQEEARKSIKRSLELYPHFDKSWLIYAMIEEQAGNVNKAIQGYTSFLERTTIPNKTIQNHLLELVFRQKMAAENKKSININRSCFNHALLLFQKKEYRKALKYIDNCLQEEPENDEKKVMKIQILSAMGKPVQAAYQLHAWINRDPHNDLWFNTLHLLCKKGLSYKIALHILHAIEKQQPGNILPLLYQADMYLRINHIKQAEHYLNKSLKKTSDKQLQTKIMFQLGLLYYKQKQYQKMKTILENGNKLDASFPPLLNLLAYYYATKENNLETAQQLITQALTYDKYNPYFLDTQAMIFYKQGNYNKALALLNTAAGKQRDNFTITKHLGKTLYKVGQKDKAIHIMQQAQQIAHNRQEKQSVHKLMVSWQKI